MEYVHQTSTAMMAGPQVEACKRAKKFYVSPLIPKLPTFFMAGDCPKCPSHQSRSTKNLLQPAPSQNPRSDTTKDGDGKHYRGQGIGRLSIGVAKDDQKT